LADKLDAFVTYLKEKPESRDVSYMARETHAVKCCYRCGFVYRDGDVCPKCGNRNNE
jgi:anaerobic ribonucleoside-triphosphate reductase